jgi:hypothetical protein
MPTSGRALDAVAASATLHCLTGCAIGEVVGVVVGTALGFSDFGTIALAIGLAFLFGYTLTSLPLLRAGFALSAVIPIALASDTLSIATMELVDNAILLIVPGAMDAGVGDVLFWGALSFALVVAGLFAFPVNRWLIARGKGHVAVHETGIHGGPPVRVVAIVAAIAAVFGTTVLIREAIVEDDMGRHGGETKAAAHGGGAEAGGADPVRGLAVAENGLQLELAQTELPRGRESELRFDIVDAEGQPVRDYEVEHAKRMHLIIARRDLTGFQHLHPKLGEDGAWSTSVALADAGSYRVFADFKRDGQNHTLASDLFVDGPADWRQLPAARPTATTADGYEVRIDQSRAEAGKEAELGFSVARGRRQVAVEDYLGAKGHLVALREGDLAYLHVHPVDTDDGSGAAPIRFATEFPSEGRYRLFLQFKHRGDVQTAAFTQVVAR